MKPAQALQPCSFVIFGATGNLSTNKLLPALYHLEVKNRIQENMSFIAFSRREWGQEEWLAHMKLSLQSKLGAHFDGAVFERFAARFCYVQGELHDLEAYRSLVEVLGRPKCGACSNVVFYLAIKPTEFGAVINNLDAVGLNKPRGLHRVVVEKPFGEDIESARMLNELLHRHFDEEQVFRIDHYLG
ncbi:MAG: glucose-6-phosphate dehydrogenase, partial [Sulfuricella sp.]